jgi:2-C-methyl-D-erythritol 4-phosphate cytidylyltransferase
VIKQTVQRDYLRAAETPQVFSIEIYEKALKASEGTCVTDDNMMAELVGAKITAVETAGYNFKITTPADVEYAEFLIERGHAE